MKKISNWVFGSFFRTMGRFFFFLFFGFLLATILSRSEIKWTDLLGIETIKASTYETQWIPSTDISTNWGSSWGGLGSNDSGYYVVYDSITSNNSPVNYWFRFKNNGSPVSYDLSGVEEITNTFQMNVRNIDQIELDFSQYLCTMSNNIDSGTGQHYTTSMICDPTLSSQNIVLPKVQYGIDIAYFYDNDVTRLKHCNIIASTAWNLTVSCPVSTSNISGFRITIDNATTNSLLFSTGFYFSYTKKMSATQQIIDNQNQNTNQTISTITDTNTTEADTQATNFFDNFSSQDNGGISSIITAPLSAISGLASATCTPITLPIPYLDNKQLVLPCMSAIYTEHFGSFFSLYQTIIFGVVAYRMLVSIFMMIQGFKNPDDDKIEVVDL